MSCVHIMCARFKDTSVILFLNKKDLFAAKIQKLPITVCPEFADYDGAQDYDECCEYIQDMFVERYTPPKGMNSCALASLFSLFVHFLLFLLSARPAAPPHNRSHHPWRFCLCKM